MSIINHNCTHSVEHKGILQGPSPFGMAQSFWMYMCMTGTNKAKIINYSLDTTLPRIPNLIYHQSNKSRYDDSITSILTTDQTTLVV